MILGADQDEGAAPQAACDLDVPVVPALVGDDEIFLRRQEAHEAAEQDLLFVAAVAPVGEIEGTLAPREARWLARLRHRLGRAVMTAPVAQPPFEALPAAQGRADIDEERHQRAGLEAAEALVD